VADYSQKLDVIIRMLKEGNGAQEASRDLETLDGQQKKAKRSADELGDSFKKITASIAGYIGLQKMIALIKDSVRAFAEQEQAVTKVEGVLRANGQYTAEYSKHLQQLASDLQKVTLIGDEKSLPIIANLVANGASAKDVALLTERVLDLGAGLGNVN
jgi:seryl-tRNA synthetase